MDVPPDSKAPVILRAATPTAPRTLPNYTVSPAAGLRKAYGLAPIRTSPSPKSSGLASWARNTNSTTTRTHRSTSQQLWRRRSNRTAFRSACSPSSRSSATGINSQTPAKTASNPRGSHNTRPCGARASPRSGCPKWWRKNVRRTSTGSGVSLNWPNSATKMSSGRGKGPISLRASTPMSSQESKAWSAPRDSARCCLNRLRK